MTENPRDRTWEPGAFPASGGARPSSPRTRLAALFALALAVAAAFAAYRGLTREETGKTPLSLAQSLAAQGEFARAATMLQAEHRAHPSEPLRIELARILLGAGQNHEAREALRVKFSDELLEREADYLRAETLIRLRRYDEASAIAGALGAKGRAEPALLLSARAAYGAGRQEEASSLIGAALRAGGPSLGEAWLLRARFALDANDLDAAKAAIARAREAGAPKRAAAAAEIESLIRGGAFDEAAAAISKLRAQVGLKARQSDPLSEYLSSMLASATGDFTSATRRLRGADRWLATIVNGPLLQAMAQAGAGDVAQADYLFRALVKETPTNGLFVAAAGDWLIDAGRLDEARDLADRLSSAAPPDAIAYLRLAIARAEANPDAAVEAAKAFAELSFPASPDEVIFGPHSLAAEKARAEHQRARALAQAASALFAGETRLAARTARQFDNPAAGPAMAILTGELYLAAGDDARATSAFDRALAAAPTSASALRGRVRVEVRAGDLQAAEAILANSVEAAPNFLAARILLARVLMVDQRAIGAAEALAPAEAALLESPDGAELYAAALKASGESQKLSAFASAYARRRGAEPTTVTLLDLAGDHQAAAAAAREAVLAAPNDRHRVEAYREAMRKAGKPGAADSFLAALERHGLGRSTALSAATPDGGDAGLDRLRRDFTAAPDDAAVISRFGTALARAGALTESVRVMREACFWAGFGGCAPESLSHS